MHAIITRSWLQGQNFMKNKLLENKEMYFKNGIINIQTVGYNAAHTVDQCLKISFLDLKFSERVNQM